jgi:UDP-N-acetylmuramyl pentapeptide phosphotransferase/UDP-N-acetylglucosamine-1-phosphate transferase
MHPVLYLAAFACAMVTSLVGIPIVARMARRWGIIDVPNARKVHAVPTPRIGGLAIAAGLFISVIATALMSGAFFAASSDSRAQLITLLAAGAFLLLVGLADDVADLSAKYKLIVLLAASGAAASWGARIDTIRIFDHVYSFGWMAWPVSMLWIVGVTVSINFIDGLDGLAGGLCAIAALLTAIVAALAGQVLLTLVALGLAGSLCGFLWFNFHPAKIFMGDCGSLMTGFVLACCMLLEARSVGTFNGPMLPTIALAVPLIDTFLTVIRRGIIHRRSIFSAEREHIHHRLLDMGLQQKHAVLLLYAATLAAAVAGLVCRFGNHWAGIGAIILLTPILLGIFQVSGSTRAKETVQAIKRNRAIGRETNYYRKVFDDMQLRMRATKSIDGWWRECCAAAELFDFLALKLPVTTRDGKSNLWVWRRGEDHIPREGCVTATLPIRHRRTDGELRVELSVGVHTSLESAAHRIQLFSRLVGEHSVADLPLVKRPERPVRPPVLLDERTFLDPDLNDSRAGGLVTGSV